MDQLIQAYRSKRLILFVGAGRVDEPWSALLATAH